MGESFRDRLASLSRRELAALCGVAIVALAGVGLWYVRSLPRPVDVRSVERPASAVTVTPSPTVIVVDVAGWVRHPGVYEFHTGDRVIDALQAAGGARKGAALEVLNLAALLTDAQQVLVSKEGGAPVAGSTATSSTGAAGAPVNVNTATESELEELPGIGPVLAQRIIDYRTEHGPFASVDQLEDVSGIGPSTLEDLRDLVTV